MKVGKVKKCAYSFVNFKIDSQPQLQTELRIKYFSLVVSTRYNVYTY